jgi:WD40 repeat protein
MQRLSLSFSALVSIVITGLCPVPIEALTQDTIPLNDLAWNTAGTMLAVARNDGSIELFNASGKSIAILQVADETDSIRSVSWSPVQDNRLAFGSRRGTVKVIDVKSDRYEVIRRIPVAQNYIREVSWNTSGTYLATSGETGGGNTCVSTLAVWDANTGDEIITWKEDFSVVDLAWHPILSNMLLVSTVEDNYGAELIYWDVESDAVLWTIHEPESGVIGVTWSSPGNKFASATDDWEGVRIRIHEVSTGFPSVTLPTEITSVTASMTWYPNDYLAVSGYLPEDDKGVVQVWDTETKTIIQQAVYSDAHISILAWHPTGKLALGSGDGTILIEEDKYKP